MGVMFAATVVHAQEEGSGGSGGEEAPAEEPPKPKKPVNKPAAKKPAAKKGKQTEGQKAAAASGPKFSADIPLEALSALPVEPLSMDAAALKDDDRMFDMLPKQLSGNENVEALTESLKKAAGLLSKMKRDVEAEKVWTKNVYDIIQNYQYKYLKTVKDVKMRARKIRKMEKLVALLKQSTLHSSVERELAKASKALGELVSRAGTTGGVKGSRVYSKITARMQKLKSALANMPRPRELYSETTNKMKKILRNKLPPKTSDALQQLAGASKPKAAKAKAAKPAAKKAAKPAKPAAKKPKAKKAAAKKPKAKKATKKF